MIIGVTAHVLSCMPDEQAFMLHINLWPTIARYESCSVSCRSSVTLKFLYQQHFSRFGYYGASATWFTSNIEINSRYANKYLANKRDVRAMHVLTVIRFFDNAAWLAKGSIWNRFRSINASDMLADHLCPIISNCQLMIFPKESPSCKMIGRGEQSRHCFGKSKFSTPLHSSQAHDT